MRLNHIQFTLFQPECALVEPLRERLPSDGVDDEAPLFELARAVDGGRVTLVAAHGALVAAPIKGVGGAGVLPVVPLQAARAKQVLCEKGVSVTWRRGFVNYYTRVPIVLQLA